MYTAVCVAGVDGPAAGGWLAAGAGVWPRHGETLPIIRTSTIKTKKKVRARLSLVKEASWLAGELFSETSTIPEKRRGMMGILLPGDAFLT